MNKLTFVFKGNGMAITKKFKDETFGIWTDKRKMDGTGFINCINGKENFSVNVRDIRLIIAEEKIGNAGPLKHFLNTIIRNGKYWATYSFWGIDDFLEFVEERGKK